MTKLLIPRDASASRLMGVSFARRLVQLFRPDQVRPDSQVRLAVYNTYDARAFFSELLERVRNGEEIVVARAGEPVAKLIPYGGEAVKPGLFRAHVYVHDGRAAPRVRER